MPLFVSGFFVFFEKYIIIKSMESYLPENEYKEFENRVYVNPQTTVDETNAFIDNLRSTQTKNNQEINTQTQNLGTEIASNLGGLTGGEGYFTSRYQTPQTNSVAENLRATAQAKALNDVLSNEEEMWKKRYNDAYREYQKRVYDNSNGGGGGGNTGGSTGDPASDGEVETNVSTTEQGHDQDAEYTDYDHSSWSDFVAGKGEETISYTKDGRTYFANVYRVTGLDPNRQIKVETSEGNTYTGQAALNYLNGIVSGGGKIYSADGQEISPYRALTGDTGRF